VALDEHGGGARLEGELAGDGEADDAAANDLKCNLLALLDNQKALILVWASGGCRWVKLWELCAGEVVGDEGASQLAACVKSALTAAVELKCKAWA
jgi:hypothetical protein